MDENQHNLVKTARNFDASPAVTSGNEPGPLFWSVLEGSGAGSARSAAWGASPLNPPRHKSLVYAIAGVSSWLCKKTRSPQMHVNMHLNHIVMMIYYEESHL